MGAPYCLIPTSAVTVPDWGPAVSPTDADKMQEGLSPKGLDQPVSKQSRVGGSPSVNERWPRCPVEAGSGTGPQRVDARQAYFQGPEGTDSTLGGSQFTQEGSGLQDTPFGACSRGGGAG